jgi:hypothetical protein
LRSGSYKAAAVFQVQFAATTTADIQHSFETEFRVRMPSFRSRGIRSRSIDIDRLSYHWHNVFQL